MSESRDSNDPRDMMRGMRKEAQAEFDREEAGTTGGQEHASRAEREGTAPRREAQPDAGSTSRSAREQPDASRGDPATGGGATSAPAEPSGE
jgi:hypothetical protein